MTNEELNLLQNLENRIYNLERLIIALDRIKDGSNDANYTNAERKILNNIIEKHKARDSWRF